MPTFALSQVDPVALTICKQGANRQRIFLRKSTAVEDLLALPTRTSILKGDDWSVFYCVVAEPDAREDPGLVGEEGSEDVWADEDEIRKAAHRLLKNGAYVNAMHDALAEEGCAIVENAVALTDLDVGGTIIKKGSWYVAVEPTPAFREKVDAGDITGVSLEGTGLRTLIEKDAKGAQGPDAKKCAGCGGTVKASRSTCQNCGRSFVKKGAKEVGPAARKKLKGLLDYYRKKPHPFGACVRDNTKRFGKDGAERVCATLKDLEMGTTKWRHGGKVAKAGDADAWLDSHVDALIAAGVDSDPAIELLEEFMGEQAALVSGDVEALAKSTTDFADRIAAADLQTEMWRAWDALQATIYEAYRDESGDDPAVVVRRSIDQFSTYLQAKLGEVTTSPLAKGLGSVDGQNADEEADVGLAEDLADLRKKTDERLTAIAKDTEGTNQAVAGLVTVTEKLLERIDGGTPPAGKVKKEGDAPSDLAGVVQKVGELADQMDTFDAGLTGIAKAIRALGEGDTAQDGREKVAKTNGKDPLAGLLD